MTTRAWLCGGVVAAFLSGCLAASAGAAGSFVSRACPKTPFEVAPLKTARCGTLTVPENRSKANGRTVRLSVAILRARAANPPSDPIVFMSGGPGEDPILAADVLVDQGLNAERDVIVMSQRGHYSSTPRLTCPEVDAFRDRQVGLPYAAASTGRLMGEAVRACRRRFVADGVDLSAYNTLENAADFADLRTALGIPQWNVYGASYGTDLARTYMERHPEGIRAVTIDGIVPPNRITLGGSWPSTKEGADNVFRACARDASCSKRYPEIGATFKRLVAKLQANPISLRFKVANGQTRKVVVDGAVLVNWLVRTVSNIQDGALVPRAIARLARNQPATIAGQWANLWTNAKFRGLFGYGLLFGVTCGEWIPAESAATSLATARKAFPSFPDSVLSSTPQIPFQRENCRIWNVPKQPAIQRTVTTSSIPTLVASGGFDAKTGAQWGVVAARTLPNSTVITIPGVGHGAVIFSPCGISVMHSFFNAPNAPDTRCVAKVKLAPFK